MLRVLEAYEKSLVETLDNIVSRCDGGGLDIEERLLEGWRSFGGRGIGRRAFCGEQVGPENIEARCGDLELCRTHCRRPCDFHAPASACVRDDIIYQNRDVGMPSNGHGI